MQKMEDIEVLPEQETEEPKRSAPGDYYTCRICLQDHKIPDNDEVRGAMEVVERMGVDPLAHLAMINVCPRCSAELNRPRSRIDADGKKVAMDPMDPSLLMDKMQKVTRTKFHKPFRAPDEYLDTDPRQLPYPKAFAKVMAYKFGRKGLVLFGDTGAGKSRSAWYLMANLHMDGRSTMGIDCQKMANLAQEKFRDGTGHQWVEQMVMTDVLFIDDLGNESKGERGEGTLFTVIKRRAEAGRPVIVTTQHTNRQIHGLARNKKRALAMIRRLSTKCDLIIFAPPEE